MSHDFRLGDEEEAALGMIIGGRLAWTGGLAEAVVRRLMEVGLVTLWSRDAWGHELDGGPYATLTPWGAERLGVELRERYWVKWVHHPTHWERILVEEPYWARVNSRVHGVLKIPHLAQQCGLRYPQFIPDRSADSGYLVDEEGVPVTFFGNHRVRIDRRLSKYRGIS